MISIVIPVFNEEETLPKLSERLVSASAAWNDTFEVILVDDGSSDRTPQMLKELCQRDPRFKSLSFSRNFGHQTAVTAGLNQVSGDVVAVMDADLQDPPEVLPRFLEKWREGYDVVYAIRKKRKEGPFKRFAYWAFYRILDYLSSIKIPLDSGDFCIMDRRVVDLLNALPERNRFVRGLRSWLGFRQIGVEYERDARYAGEVKYTLRKLLQLAFDGIVSFTYRPLQMIGAAGLVISLLSFLGFIAFFILSVFDIHVLGHSPRESPGSTTLTLAVLFLGGVQLISLGVIGEYLGRIFDEVKQRPQYIVKDSVGLGTVRVPRAPRRRRAPKDTEEKVDEKIAADQEDDASLELEVSRISQLPSAGLVARASSSRSS
ncbi:MAG: glycosyltransferase family 2 protein [Polyangiaceae bacterium]